MIGQVSGYLEALKFSTEGSSGNMPGIMVNGSGCSGFDVVDFATDVGNMLFQCDQGFLAKAFLFGLIFFVAQMRPIFPFAIQ